VKNAIAPRKATSIDAFISVKLRAARKQSGLSQNDAAEALGVSFQQIQKYEKGTNRISVGSLFTLASLYKLPASWFFDGLQNNPQATSDVSTKLLAQPHGAELAESFLAIKSASGRAAVVQAAAAFASLR
jgi:transcriptional regulator with XRE-family HTH domain